MNFARCALVVCAAVALARGARAEDSPADAPADAETPSYWSRGAARPFVALDAEAGAYIRAVAALGYGKPHWLWAGAEASGFATLDFTSAYAGLRANLLAADLQLGVRRIWSLAHGTIASARSDSIDAFRAAPSFDYTALSADLSGGLPVPSGFAIYEFEALHVTDLSAGQDLFEEWDHVVTASGSLFATRLGYLAALGRGGFFKVGPMGDLTASFGRGTTARVGGVVSIDLTDHLDLAGLLLLTARSPDSLGFKGSYGSLRLRWTWASGESTPGFK